MLCHVAETSGVSEHTFVKFLNSFEVQEIDEGERIVKRGVQVKGWYMILKGHVEVSECTTKIHLHEGNCFGSPALLRGKNGGLSMFGRGDGISVTSYSKPHCTLAIVSRKRFLELLDCDKGLSEFFHKHAETQIKMREKRKSYNAKRRRSVNLPRKKQIQHIQATAKTTRRAKFTRTNSGHRMVNKYKILSRLGRGAYVVLERGDREYDSPSNNFFLCFNYGLTQLETPTGTVMFASVKTRAQNMCTL